MDPRHLELAAQFCKLVDAPNLLHYLGAAEFPSAADAQGLLKERRKRLQSMQANPKFRDTAKFFIKHYRVFDELLADPPAYLASVGSAVEDEKLPMLTLALDSVLADGVFSDEEEAFVRDIALELGVSEARYEALVRDRCAARKVGLPSRFRSTMPAAPSLPSGLRTAPVTRSTEPRPPPMPAREQAAGWWDRAFTNTLLDFIPEGTKRLVDLAAGMGWAGITLTRARPGLEYLGIEGDEARLRMANTLVSQQPERGRIVLASAEPTALPIPEEAIDLVLCVMSLQRFGNTETVLAEAMRVLRPGGRVVLVEGDALAQQFWFDGTLVDFGRAFQVLCQRVDHTVALRLTAVSAEHRVGFALGPQLPLRLRGAGFTVSKVAIHPVQTVEEVSVATLADRLEHRVVRMARAAGLGTSSPELSEAVRTLEVIRTQWSPNFVGTSAHLLPTFFAAGVKT